MYPADFPALGRGPFLTLMQEKNQKKIKPPAGGEEVWLGTCLEGVFFCALLYPDILIF